MSRSVLLLALLASPAAIAEAPKPPELAMESYKLPNGLKVVLHRDDSVPRVSVLVAYHVGSKNERAGRTGFAHFFEHMMFRGTKHVPNYDIPLQETGAQSNAFTTEDMTVYFETVPSNFLERALYLESERLAFLPSALDKEKFDTERKVVNERRQSYENAPYGLAGEAISAKLFPEGHPYSWSVIGSMKDLNGATLDDLKRFFAEYYHPGNATLCLAGDFDPAAAKALIASYFGPLAAGPAPAPVKGAAVKPKSQTVTLLDEVQLPRVYLAWPTVADDHPDAAALDLLAEVLAGGEAARLHRVLVRDARVATDASADSDTKEIAGLFTIDATAAEGKDLPEIRALIAKELDRIRGEEPSADELALALSKHEKATYSALTSPLSRAITLAVGFSQKDDPAYYKREFDRYFRVTPGDIRRVAKTYLTPATLELDVRPVGEGQKESEAVEAGPLPDPRPEAAPAGRLPKAGPDWAKMPGPGEARAFRTPRVDRRRLSNGIELWVAPWKTLPLVDVRLMVPAGTGDDPAGKAGLGSLVATLLAEGTRAKTATELTEELDRLGATRSVGVSSDWTTLHVSVLARTLDPTLSLVAETLNTPRFDPEDFGREKQLALAELLQGPDDVNWIAGRAFRALIHGAEHPYGSATDGYTETVGRVTLDDVKTFHASHFGPAHAKLVVVGDVDADRLVPLLERTLGTWKAKTAEPRPRPVVKVAAEPGAVYFVDKPGAVQSVVSVGRRWVERQDPRYFATLLGNRILGADFLSRLNQNLRQKNGFTYGAHSSFHFQRTGSLWFASSSVRGDATAPALRETLAELDGLAKGRPFTTEEVGTNRDAEMRSYPESFEAPGGIAGTLAELAEFGLPPEYLVSYLEKLQAVKPDDVVKAMLEVVSPKDRVVLVVGDRKSVEPKLKELGFKDVRYLTPDGRPVGK